MNREAGGRGTTRSARRERPTTVLVASWDANARNRLVNALWIDGHTVGEVVDEHRLACFLDAAAAGDAELSDVIVCDVSMAGLGVLQGLGRASSQGSVVVLIGAASDETERRVQLLCRGCVIFRASAYLDDIRTVIRNHAVMARRLPNVSRCAAPREQTLQR